MPTRPQHAHTHSSSSVNASSPETSTSSFWGGGSRSGGGGGSTTTTAYSTTTTLPPGSALSSSSSPRKKMVVGGQVSRRVGMFSPTLEEDESGVFGSPGGGGAKVSSDRRPADDSTAAHSSSVVSSPMGGGGVRKKAAAYEGGASGASGLGNFSGEGGKVYALGAAVQSDPADGTTQPLRIPTRRALPSQPPSSAGVSSPSTASRREFNLNPIPPPSPSTPTRPARCPPLDFSRTHTVDPPSSDQQPSSSSLHRTDTNSPTKQLLLNPHSIKGAPSHLTSALSSPTKSSQANTSSPSTNTRALVARFESPLPTPHRPPPSAASLNTTPRTPSRQHLDKPLPSPTGGYDLGSSGSPRKSPLREGFKKLVGKFGGGAMGKKRMRRKKSGGWESGTDEEGTGVVQESWRAREERMAEEERQKVLNVEIRPPRPSRDTMDARDLAASPTKSLQTQSTSESSASQPSQTLRTGPLFFYSSTSIPPHWLRTTATLHPGSLVLSSSSLRGEPHSRTISLRACQVVRSVPEREARDRWVSPLWNDDADEDDEEEVHYLELGWGGSAETIVVAVLTVGERLGWVSSIWDAVLGGSNPISPPQPEPQPTFAAQSLPPQHLPQHASPQESLDSLLPTPPQDPHATLAQPSYSPDITQRASLYITNSDEGHHPTDAPIPRRESIHVRRPSDDGPPRLRRPKLGGKVDEIRLSVERMFGAGMFEGEGYLTSPPPVLDGGEFGRTDSQSQSATSTQTTRTGESGSGLSKAERMEDPSELRSLEEMQLASRLRNLSHHQQSSTGNQYFASRTAPINIPPRTGRSDSFSSQPMTSPNDGPPPSMVHSETPSFDMSDLNPSRSASQIQRRPTPAGDQESTMTGYTYHQRRQQRAFEMPSAAAVAPLRSVGQEEEDQFEDLATPKTSIHGGSVAPSRVATAVAAAERSLLNAPTTQAQATPPGVDLAPVISLLTSSEANSSTRSQLFDLKLSTVQASLSKLLSTDDAGREQLERLESSLVGVGIDLKEVVDGLRLRAISPPTSTVPLPAVEEDKEEEAKNRLLEEVNGKLDGLLGMFEKLAMASAAGAAVGAVGGSRLTGEVEEAKERSLSAEGPPPVKPIEGIPGGKMFVVNPAEPSVVGGEEGNAAVLPTPTEEATMVLSESGEKMPEGASSSLSNKSLSAAASPTPAAPAAELVEVLTLVKEQQTQRAVQTQQTSDIARYLNELNSWMEQFVKSGHNAVDAVSSKVDSLHDLISPPPLPTPELGQAPPTGQAGMMGLLNEVRTLAMELRDRSVEGKEEGGGVRERLEGVLAVMEQDRGRYQQQNNAIDTMMGMITQHKMENEQLLRAVAVDLSREIQGERLRFVDAMSQATSVNVNLHVEEFKKLLSQEVARSMHDLGRIREEKKHLEQQIAELFATKVKFSGETGVGARGSVGGAPSRPTSSVGGVGGRRPSQPMLSPHPPPKTPLPPVPGQGR